VSPTEIAAWGKGFRFGLEAGRDAMRARGEALLAEADAIAPELVVLKLEVARLETLSAAEPERPGALH
jgi:hypothetical protein